MPVEETAEDWDEGRLAATKARKKPAKPRKPEEVWYDVHKHPEGVPGGMGKSPEHHLRNRGWSGHEIHGPSRKTMQYHNPKFPDFVISFGGGTPQKPDHNFRILYMGTDPNISKVHHAYQPSEAMNKVEELHSMQSDHVVQPLTAVQASVEEDPRATPSPFRGARVLADRGWTHVKPAPGLQIQEHFIRDGGKQKIIPPSREWPAWRTYHNGVMVGSHPDVNLAARAADDAKFYEQIPSAVDDTWEAMERELGEEFPHEAATAQPKTFVAPATPPSQQRDMNDDNEHPIGPPKVDFPTQPEREHDWKKPKKQLQEIPDPPEPKRSRVAAVYQIAEQDTWEEPFQKTALGDLRYGPGHPREGDLMSDDDASNYLMSFRTSKPKPEDISDLEHGEVMDRMPQLDPSGSSEYSLWDPSVGVGSNKRVWLRADPKYDMFWHVGHDDREGNVVGSTQKSEPLEKALERVSNLGRSLGWL